MDQAPSASIRDHFATLTAPRSDHTTPHHLLAIITMALCGVSCGAERGVEIEQVGHAKLPWLPTCLELPNGIPSHATFGRVCAALDPAHFQQCLLGWVQAVMARTSAPLAPGQVVARAGTMRRRSPDRPHGQAALHLGSAWAAEHRLVVGQRAVDAKANEITARPALVPVRALAGCRVTSEALGCQTASAQAILDQRADYVLARTGNQPALEQAVPTMVTAAQATGFRHLAHDQHTTGEQGHGRSEGRRGWTMSEPESLAYRNTDARWPGLHRIGMIAAERTVGSTTSQAVRSVISSLAGAAQQLAHAVRQHWGIAHGLQWVLDMAFREDDCRVRQGEAAQTVAVLRQVALNLWRQERTAKIGVKAKRLTAGWDEQ